MHVGGALDDGAAVADDLVGPFEAGQRPAGLGEEVRGVDGGRGERGERAEQGDLPALEVTGPPVRGEQDTDDVRAEHQRHAEDGDQALVPHPGVDGVGVLEAGVLEVVVGDVRPRGLGDQSAEPLAHAEAQLLEVGRDGPFRHPHVGVAAGGVVQGEVGDVRAQQRAGPLHDRLEDGVQVPESGQVVRGLEERRQLRLATPPPLQFGAHPQREQLGPLQRGDPVVRAALRTGEQHRLLVRLHGGAAGQQFEERGLRAAVGHAGGAPGAGALGRLDVIAGHGHRIPYRPPGTSGLWKTPGPGVAAPFSGPSSRRRAPATCR